MPVSVSLFTQFIFALTYDLPVVHRPLAMQEHQRTTTPVALGSSFSSTTWRVVSSEGKASWFLSRNVYTVNLIITVSWGQYMYFINSFLTSFSCCPSVAVKLHLFWCNSPNVCFSQGSHWKVPTREVPGGVQRQEWEVDWRPSQSHFYLIFHYQYVGIKTILNSFKIHG